MRRTLQNVQNAYKALMLHYKICQSLGVSLWSGQLHAWLFVKRGAESLQREDRFGLWAQMDRAETDSPSASG